MDEFDKYDRQMFRYRRDCDIHFKVCFWHRNIEENPKSIYASLFAYCLKTERMCERVRVGIGGIAKCTQWRSK